MKQKIIKRTTISSAVTAALLLSQSIYALPNGKPFQELNALIEQNATAIDSNGELIEQNSTAILSLSSELSSLDGRVGVLETTVDGITSRFATLETIVTSNTNSITLAFARITSVQTDLSNLDATVATNTQAIADADAALATAEEALNQLNTDLFNLNNTVATNQSAISDVEAAIVAAEERLSQLELDVVANATEIQATKDDLNDLDASLASLKAIVDSNLVKITDTESAIFDANNNIVTLTTQYDELQTLISSTADASTAAITVLKTELTALIAANTVDINTNETELKSLNDSLLALAQSNSVIAQDLRDQMLALALLVDSNSTSITALQTQVGTLSSTLTTLNAQYNSLSALYDQLKDHIDTHHDELANLSMALSSLSNRVDLFEEAYPIPLPTFTYTDEYNVDDSKFVPQIRQFFIDTPTLDKWVHVVFNTPNLNKVTELCVLDDNDLFSATRIPGLHATNVFNHTATGAYRLNNGDWNKSRMNVISFKEDARDSVQIQAYAHFKAGVQYFDMQALKLYETMHQSGWHTVSSKSSTTTTITVSSDRFDVCGY